MKVPNPVFSKLFAPIFAATVLTVPCAHAAGKVCDVHAQGATGDGHTKDTAALQRAIDTCSVPGGGTVYFPAGTYVSGPLDWKSHVRLQLAAGATLLGSPDMTDFPLRADAPWRRVSLLHADHAVDIALIGAGTVRNSAGSISGMYTRAISSGRVQPGPVGPSEQRRSAAARADS